MSKTEREDRQFDQKLYQNVTAILPAVMGHLIAAPVYVPFVEVASAPLIDADRLVEAVDLAAPLAT